MQYKKSNEKGIYRGHIMMEQRAMLKFFVCFLHLDYSTRSAGHIYPRPVPQPILNISVFLVSHQIFSRLGQSHKLGQIVPQTGPIPHTGLNLAQFVGLARFKGLAQFVSLQI